MKKFILLFVVLFAITGCSFFEKSDAVLFKEEYEKLNGEVSSSSKIYPRVEIPKDNPVVYTSALDIQALMNEKKSGVIYFGYPDCPWCRNALPVLLEVLKDEGVSVLYYQNMKEERDMKEISDQGDIVTTKEGTKNYQLLLELLDDILDEYTVTKDGKEISLGEKRIYVPLVVFIKDGKIIGSHLDTVSSQTDPYRSLNEDEKKELYQIYLKFVQEMSSCAKEGC